MVAPATPSSLRDEANRELWGKPTLAFRTAFQRMGINPDQNYLAQRSMERLGKQFQTLWHLYGQQDLGNTQAFADALAGYNAGGGGSGYDFSPAGIRQQLAAARGATGGDLYDWLRDGDADEQVQRQMALESVARQNQTPGFARAALNRFGRQAEQWQADLINNPAGHLYQTFADAVVGRATPRAVAAAAATATPLPPGDQAGYVAPGGNAPAPGTTAAPGSSAPAPVPAAPVAAGGAPAGVRSWRDLIGYLMQGHDARNLMTSGMRHPGRAFSYGGITYDPTQDQGQGRNDRNPQGRFGGGAGWAGFVYRLQQLMQQRDRGGNAALGITAQTDDTALAQMAADWVRRTYRGGTGFGSSGGGGVGSSGGAARTGR